MSKSFCSLELDLYPYNSSTHDGPRWAPCFLNFLPVPSNCSLPLDLAASLPQCHCALGTPPGTRCLGPLETLALPLSSKLPLSLSPFWCSQAVGASSPPVLSTFHVGTMNLGFCPCLQVCLLTVKNNLRKWTMTFQLWISITCHSPWLKVVTPQKCIESKSIIRQSWKSWLWPAVGGLDWRHWWAWRWRGLGQSCSVFI